MSDIKLSRLHSGRVTELHGESLALERPLKNLIKTNRDPLLGKFSSPAVEYALRGRKLAA